MNDRYLFRGKTEIGERWVAGYYVNDPQEDCPHQIYVISTHPCGHHIVAYSVIPETVGQCTGKKYNDGNLMFEGDIAYDKQGGYFYIVKWFPEYAGFYFADKNGQIAFGVEELEAFLDNLVVMGNIHNNPELLK